MKVECQKKNVMLLIPGCHSVTSLQKDTELSVYSWQGSLYKDKECSQGIIVWGPAKSSQCELAPIGKKKLANLF